MTADTPDYPPTDDETTPTAIDLVQTTGPELADDPDPEVVAVLEEQGLTEREYAAMLAIQKRLQEADTEPDDETDETDEDSTHEDSTYEDRSATGEQCEEGLDGTHEEKSDETPAEISSSVTDPATDDAPPEPAIRRVSDPETVSLSEDGAADLSNEATTEAQDKHDVEADVEGRSLDVSLHPLASALAERQARRAGGGQTQSEAIDRVILEAVDSYLAALLAGEAAGDEDEHLTVTLDVSSRVEEALLGLVEDDDRFSSLEALVTDGLVSVLGIEHADPRTVTGLATYEQQLSAVAANDEYAFEAAEEVADAAIVWYCSHPGT